jgi:hypothetical protein
MPYFIAPEHSNLKTQSPMTHIRYDQAARYGGHFATLPVTPCMPFDRRARTGRQQLVGVASVCWGGAWTPPNVIIGRAEFRGSRDILCPWDANPLVACLLIPWSRVLEKLTILCSWSRNSLHFYGTRKFFTVLTSARHLSLSWTNSIQSPQPLQVPEDPS